MIALELQSNKRPKRSVWQAKYLGQSFEWLLFQHWNRILKTPTVGSFSDENGGIGRFISTTSKETRFDTSLWDGPSFEKTARLVLIVTQMAHPRMNYRQTH